ncbi:MAG TPA: hypothetical protein VGA06_02265 [Candidatus Paceibacterota bacterium]
MLHISHKFYMAVSAIIFFLAGAGHGFRAFYEWELVYNGWFVPLWISWLAALVAFLMAIAAVRHMH